MIVFPLCSLLLFTALRPTNAGTTLLAQNQSEFYFKSINTFSDSDTLLLSEGDWSMCEKGSTCYSEDLMFSYKFRAGGLIACKTALGCILNGNNTVSVSGSPTMSLWHL